MFCFLSVLQYHERVKTLELPRRVRGNPDGWDPNVCLSFGEAALLFLKDHLNDMAKKIVKTEFDDKKGVVMGDDHGSIVSCTFYCNGDHIVRIS